LNILWYFSVAGVTLLLLCFGLMLVWISLSPAFLELLISLSPQLPSMVYPKAFRNRFWWDLVFEVA
jgi:hypothetical protein